MKSMLFKLLIVSLTTSLCLAQTTAPAGLDVLKDRPDLPPADLLGGRYESQSAGIAFGVPTNCVQIKKTGDEIARFMNEGRSWELVAARNTTNEPIPLTAGGQFQRSGLIEIVISQIKHNNPNAEILRQDVINVNQSQAGMIAARITVGTQRRLLQQVIVQANDQLYYSITLTSPAAKKDATGEDPAEKLAVDTFGALVDSVKLLDLGPVRNDQNERLFRTRAFYVKLAPEQLKKALVPEQWLRFIKDGKDIGYTYIIEEAAAEGANDGVKIGIRSRTMPDANSQVDAETWYFMSYDRRHETWSNLAFLQDKKSAQRTHVSEIGAGDALMKRITDQNVPLGMKPQVIETIDLYNLTVTTAGKTANTAPFKLKCPPYYLPQALGHLLPRVLPQVPPKTFMFYTWVSDSQKVMARYVDVGEETTVDLGGQKLRATPIKDRIGLEGSSITHYVNREGKYLGSINAEAHITILPSDADTLQRLWANNANLTRPATPEQAK